MLKRRDFVRACASAWPAMRALAAEVGAGLPPVRKVTRAPGFHWRGYYDKLLFDASGRRLLAMQASFEHRSPRADDEVRVGMVDLEDGDRWIDLGATTAWNWQQGCMLQWIPGGGSEAIWNVRVEGGYAARMLDVKSGRSRTIPSPIYCLSPDGQTAVATDFRRLNDVRPGYGYAGVPDPNRDVRIPMDAGVWSVDLATGQRKLVVSIADAAAVPYTGPAELAFGRESKHWFNHLLFNTDGTRFLFLHRWQAPGDRTFRTRMFTAGLDGKDPYVVDPHGKTSHFVWRDPNHIMAWAWHPSHGERFYLYRDRTDVVEVVGKDVMTLNGHNTYVPGTRDEWVLNDTYPDKERLQHPYLFHIPSGRRVPIGHFLLPPEYKGEWRCDTHPNSSRDGRLVSFDSPHGGDGRQICVVDIRGLLAASAG